MAQVVRRVGAPVHEEHDEGKRVEHDKQPEEREDDPPRRAAPVDNVGWQDGDPHAEAGDPAVQEGDPVDVVGREDHGVGVGALHQVPERVDGGRQHKQRNERRQRHDAAELGDGDQHQGRRHLVLDPAPRVLEPVERLPQGARPHIINKRVQGVLGAAHAHGHRDVVGQRHGHKCKEQPARRLQAAHAAHGGVASNGAAVPHVDAQRNAEQVGAAHDQQHEDRDGARRVHDDGERIHRGDRALDLGARRLRGQADGGHARRRDNIPAVVLHDLSSPHLRPPVSVSRPFLLFIRRGPQWGGN